MPEVWRISISGTRQGPVELSRVKEHPWLSNCNLLPCFHHPLSGRTQGGQCYSVTGEQLQEDNMLFFNCMTLVGFPLCTILAGSMSWSDNRCLGIYYGEQLARPQLMVLLREMSVCSAPPSDAGKV